MSLKSLRIVTVALDVHSASAKGAMHSIGGTVESRLKEVRKNDIKLKKIGFRAEPGLQNRTFQGLYKLYFPNNLSSIKVIPLLCRQPVEDTATAEEALSLARTRMKKYFSFPLYFPF